MTQSKLLKIATILDRSITENFSIPAFSLMNEDISIQEAYAIQTIGVNLRTKRGESIIGYKMGLTSIDKQKQMHVDDPIYGVLTNAMKIQSANTCDISKMIHPKVEPEIAFITKKAIRHPVTINEVVNACEGICAALDVIDSRYDNFKFGLTDVVADNCSAAKFVLSNDIKNPKNINFDNLKMTLSVNGKVMGTSSSKAILGNPANSVVYLAKLLSFVDSEIPAGSIILCGSSIAAITLEKNMNVINQVETLGSVSLKTNAST